MNLAPILHSLVWVMFLKVARVQVGQDPAKSRETLEVCNGSIFAHCQNFDDYDRAFEIMRSQGLMFEIPFPNEALAHSLERQFIFYEMRILADTLTEHLDVAGVSDELVESDLIGCFLSMANSLGKFGTEEDAPMPVAMKSAQLPQSFSKAAQALADGGYCIMAANRIAWLPKIAPIMEAEGLWVGGRPAVDLRREALVEIWREMPENLKASAYNVNRQVNPLSFWAALRRHWHPKLGWDEGADYTLLPTSRWPGEYDDLRFLADSGLLR